MKTWRKEVPISRGLAKASKPNHHTHQTSYANRRWMSQSLAFVRQYPFCVACLCRGLINRGVETDSVATQRNLVVDHVVPHGGNQDLFWDSDNWQTLCRAPCHDSEKRMCERRGLDWWSRMRELATEHGACAKLEELQAWLPPSARNGLEQAKCRRPLG
jgi:5-methylcytosine-specific restriction endonuclease McrA